MFYLIILLFLFLFLFLNGCFFFFVVPTGPITRAMYGSHCVGPNAQVDDIITDTVTGDRLKITKVSKNEDGTPFHGCGARLPNRAKVEKVESVGISETVK